MSDPNAEGNAPSPIGPLQRRLDDVRTFQLPRLRTCASAAMARDLAAEARSDLEAVRTALEEAREDAENLPVRERDAAVAGLAGIEGEYAATHAEYRAAIVAAKKASAAAVRKHELLEPLDEAPRAEASTAVGGDDALQTKTNEVTDALRRTTQLLQTELERSVLSTQMLKESTTTMRSTQGLYDNYTALLTTSGQLVRAIERADWWDRALIMAAFACFLLAVLWVVKQRVLDRVGGAAVWWVGGSFRLLRMMGGGGKAKDIAAVGGAALAAGAASSATAAAAAAAAAKAETKAKGKIDVIPIEDVPVAGADSAVKRRNGKDGNVPPADVAGHQPIDQAVRKPALEPVDIEVLEEPPRMRRKEEL
ncbi:hypothetical protein CcaverHIS002_0701800 [Cutaneotrichosporon cavernicola]|uniref:Sec20 C-terminal domain-containing protein n=1 Tax=Cutaneotrichosporon cavernicola TaxID=279322 RepID=A0AA48L9X4_9TREE|nr:uncharacterized protein CcaverHIS019_0701820 [Cutaneotrichosporon cavernicola]BEI86834.1 hypothetical protein CcaverHIS002_0701800 [Cutaneotrichosporon cavernicola]BEI94610.1 hypothetical protein CcaverHIS019_0701820 [Cutaneotrichosporon cavernicola]BEJ02387.1 hypothetical protein CcaverHIS631_0701820 [Cutaneotrichosporon cavernicola]BEJ10145.1 hypothetical protein CcaverHIS641_0701800 [Cutaneotrichosporon cavernicola]